MVYLTYIKKEITTGNGNLRCRPLFETVASRTNKVTVLARQS